MRRDDVTLPPEKSVPYLICDKCKHLFDRNYEKRVITERYYEASAAFSHCFLGPATAVNVYCPECKPPYDKVVQYFKYDVTVFKPAREQYFHQSVEVTKDGVPVVKT